MFEITVYQGSKEGPNEFTFEQEDLVLWVNRYPNGHQLAGNIKDLRIIQRKEPNDVAHTFISLKVKVKETSK